MVLPLTDDNSDRRSFPWVNYSLIAVNVLVFVVFQQFGYNEEFTSTYSCVPAEIVSGRDIETPDKTLTMPGSQDPVIDPYTGEPVVVPGLRKSPVTTYLTPYVTLLTSMFMHGGIAHIAGNMLFLWIFGDNVEDVLGKGRYLVFYLLCGLVASLAQVALTAVLSSAFSDPEMMLVPSLGASGAISGVLGGYLVLFPNKRVMVLMFRFLTWVPAWVAIGMWFVFQVISSLGVLGEGSQMGGVAYGAHMGGFVFGLALVKVFAMGRTVPGPTRTDSGYNPWRSD